MGKLIRHICIHSSRINGNAGMDDGASMPRCLLQN